MSVDDEDKGKCFPTSSSPSALVLVLGSISQSPRMQYHTYSLLLHKYNVTLVGYPSSSLFQGIKELIYMEINEDKRKDKRKRLIVR